MSLRGGPELRARLKAISLCFKPMGKEWADETASLMRPMVPVGERKHPGPKLHETIRRKSATQKRAVVAAYYSAYFVDAGTHYPKVARRKTKTSAAVGLGFRKTIFRKGGYRVRPRPFRARAAHEALRRKPLILQVIKAWNDAGKNARLRT